MTEPPITTMAQLRARLHTALQLEHAAIPPYLTALYSLHDGGNSPARHVLRVVVAEEMLHLALAANIMNAVGGTPDLTGPDFVLAYPARPPDGERDVALDIAPFSREAVETFLTIERHDRGGEFYPGIARGLRYLSDECAREGRTLFTGDHRRQVTPEFFYSGGAEPIVVTGLESALRAIDLMAGQGYHRLEQLTRGRYYQKGDTPGHPSGPALWVDWDAAYPVLKNARLDDYPPGSQLRQGAGAFNQAYAGFLRFLTRAFTGQPELLLEAVPQMFRLRDDLSRLIRNPIPDRPGTHAAPTFEMRGQA